MANQVIARTARSTHRYGIATSGGGATVTFSGTCVSVTPLEENLVSFAIRRQNLFIYFVFFCSQRNDPVYEEIPEIGNNDSISFGNHQVDRDSGKKI